MRQHRIKKPPLDLYIIFIKNFNIIFEVLTDFFDGFGFKERTQLLDNLLSGLPILWNWDVKTLCGFPRKGYSNGSKPVVSVSKQTEVCFIKFFRKSSIAIPWATL